MSPPNAKSLALYRLIVRASRRLEPEAREHYLRFTRSGYVAHADEVDEERIDEIVTRAEQDVDWILRKYTGHGLHDAPPTSSKSSSSS